MVLFKLTGIARSKSDNNKLKEKQNDETLSVKFSSNVE